MQKCFKLEFNFENAKNRFILLFLPNLILIFFHNIFSSLEVHDQHASKKVFFLQNGSILQYLIKNNLSYRMLVKHKVYLYSMFKLTF